MSATIITSAPKVGLVSPERTRQILDQRRREEDPELAAKAHDYRALLDQAKGGPDAPAFALADPDAFRRALEIEAELARAGWDPDVASTPATGRAKHPITQFTRRTARTSPERAAAAAAPLIPIPAGPARPASPAFGRLEFTDDEGSTS